MEEGGGYYMKENMPGLKLEEVKTQNWGDGFWGTEWLLTECHKNL